VALSIAIEELRSTGWTDLDSSGCAHDAGGRVYPTIERVGREFGEAGYALTIRHVMLFDCYRAQWIDGEGRPLGAVVASSAQEAAVFALTQLRRQRSAAGY
jgi:hypothetical protein